MRTILTLLSIILPVLATIAQPLPVDPELHYGTLPNGFTYYIRHNATPPGRAHFWLVHKVGSVMEEENERGLAHFLEHMAFTGTKNYSDQVLFDYLTRNGLAFGTDVNATTSYDDTQYYIQNVPTTRQTMLDSVLYIMRDLSCNLLLDSLQIDKERAIIQKERTSNSNIQLRLQEKALPVLMAGSAYAHRIPIGLPEVVNNATTTQLRTFYHRWYRPDRQALIIVGDIDATLLERKVKRIFGIMPTPVEPSPDIDQSVPDSPGLRTALCTDAEADATMISLFFKHDDLPESERNTEQYLEQSMKKMLALYMLNQRLDRTTRQAHSPMQMARANDSHYITTRSKEAFVLNAVTKPGQVHDALRQLLTEARRMAMHGFTDSELEQARAAVSSDLRQYALQVNQHESSDYVNEYIDHYLSGGYIPGVTQEVDLSLAAIARLTLQQVNALAGRWVHTDNACLLIAGPDDETFPTEDQIQSLFEHTLTSPIDAWHNQETVSHPLMSHQPRPGAIVHREHDDNLHTTTLVLSNGAKVVLQPSSRKAGEILFDAIASGGQWAMDTALTPQLKVLEAAIEDSKLGGFTQDELRTLLAGKQLAVSFGLAENHHDLQGGCATSDLETLMQAIHLYFTDVQPDTAAHQALLARLRAQIRQSQGKPDAQLSEAIARAHYGTHPAARPLTEAQLDQTRYDQLLQLYRQYVARPDQFTFIFVGDFDADTLAVLASRYIGSLPVDATARPLCASHTMHLQPGRRVATVAAPPTNDRAQIQVTLSGAMDASPASLVQTQVYGHIVEIVLNAVMREQHQLTYGVSAQAQVLLTEPRWVLQYQFACKPQDVDNAVGLATDAISLVKERGVSQALFDKVKQMMLRRHDEALTTNAYWMNVLLNRAMGRDTHTDVRLTLQSLTLDQLSQFIGTLPCDTDIQVVYR